MAHSYHHAVSTQRTHGGEVEDYLALHDWFDSSKEFLADARHRQALHQSFGIFLAQERFGTTITNSKGRAIPTRLIAEQHVIEDCRFIPSVDQAFGSMTLEPWMERNLERDHPAFHAEETVGEWGGQASDYLALHQFLERSRAHLTDPRHRTILHHAFGIVIAEGIFGSTIINSDGRQVPVREVLEAHVTRDLGVVPTLEEAFDSMSLEPWMSRNARALSRELGRKMPEEMRERRAQRLKEAAA